MGEDRNDHLDPRYLIRTADLPGLLPRVLNRLGRSYDRALRYLMVKGLELTPKDIAQKDTRWVYKTDYGTVQLSEDAYLSKTFVVFADQTLPRSEFKAGHLAVALLRTIQKTLWTPQSVQLEYIRNNKGREISELVAVDIDARLGNERVVLLEDAVPLHYENNRKIRESDDLISTLEKEAVAALRKKTRNKRSPVIVETKVANVWHAAHGALPGFFKSRRKAPGQLSTRLYRYATLTSGPGATYSGTSPRSGEAQSP